MLSVFCLCLSLSRNPAPFLVPREQDIPTLVAASHLPRMLPAEPEAPGFGLCRI